MKNNTALYVLACIITAILLIALAFDEKEIADYKANETTMQEQIATLEKQNSDLNIELQAVKERAVKAESELTEQTSAQAYIYNYHDSDYDDMSAKDYIAQRESGSDYNARNGRYIGKYQLDESMLNGDYSPENQEETAERYVMERYGSWENAQEFWDTHGWY